MSSMNFPYSRSYHEKQLLRCDVSHMQIAVQLSFCSQATCCRASLCCQVPFCTITTRWCPNSCYDAAARSTGSACQRQRLGWLKARHRKSIARADKEAIAIDNSFLDSTVCNRWRPVGFFTLFWPLYFDIHVFYVICHHFNRKKGIKRSQSKPIEISKLEPKVALLSLEFMFFLFVMPHTLQTFPSCLSASELFFC